jgi:propanol-preferring alcohol dehydrogenase
MWHTAAKRASTRSGWRRCSPGLRIGEGAERAKHDLMFNSKSIPGSRTGNASTGDATLKFSVLTGVAPMVETLPLEEAPAAYARMASGQARFRMVLTMGA